VRPGTGREHGRGSRPTFRVRHVKNVCIPTRRGTGLAADLFLPAGPTPDPNPSSAFHVPRSEFGDPFPVILEYLPYRKDDRTAPRWDTHHYAMCNFRR
jgi:predicted acyl esterase